MALCPSEHMHLLLQALKDNDCESVTLYLEEMLLWLAVAGNPLPNLRMVVVSEGAMETAQETLRERAQCLRAFVGFDFSLSGRLESEAAGHEQVADALKALCNDTDLFLVQL